MIITILNRCGADVTWAISDDGFNTAFVIPWDEIRESLDDPEMLPVNLLTESYHDHRPGYTIQTAGELLRRGQRR